MNNKKLRNLETAWIVRNSEEGFIADVFLSRAVARAFAGKLNKRHPGVYVIRKATITE